VKKLENCSVSQYIYKHPLFPRFGWGGMRRQIFDENFPAFAIQAIRQQVASVVQVGQDWGESGWLDVEQILPLREIHVGKGFGRTITKFRL
jgi:hypothetical protein